MPIPRHRLVAGAAVLGLGLGLGLAANPWPPSNQVSVVELDRAGTRGTVVTQVSDPRFDLPTTVASFGGRLYLPNFGPFEPTPDTPYTAVAIHRP